MITMVWNPQYLNLWGRLPISYTDWYISKWFYGKCFLKTFISQILMANEKCISLKWLIVFQPFEKQLIYADDLLFDLDMYASSCKEIGITNQQDLVKAYMHDTQNLCESNTNMTALLFHWDLYHQITSWQFFFTVD